MYIYNETNTNILGLFKPRIGWHNRLSSVTIIKDNFWSFSDGLLGKHTKSRDLIYIDYFTECIRFARVIDEATKATSLLSCIYGKGVSPEISLVMIIFLLDWAEHVHLLYNSYPATKKKMKQPFLSLSYSSSCASAVTLSIKIPEYSQIKLPVLKSLVATIPLPLFVMLLRSTIPKVFSSISGCLSISVIRVSSSCINIMAFFRFDFLGWLLDCSGSVRIKLMFAKGCSVVWLISLSLSLFCMDFCLSFSLRLVSTFLAVAKFASSCLT